MYNPYIAGTPLKDTNPFFGRQDILNWVASKLRSNSVNALVLFGQRRIGKTSLLFQIQKKLPFTEYLAVYIDLQDTSSMSLKDMLAYFADKAVSEIAKRDINLSDLTIPADLKFDFFTPIIKRRESSSVCVCCWTPSC